MKYKKKPVVVEAAQWFNRLGINGMKGVEWEPPREDGRGAAPYVTTIHGQRAYLADGDWVIAEPDGVHHYPCKPDIFAATYDPMPHMMMVCGVDCHPGDSVRNNYCNLAPQEGPMAKSPPPGPDVGWKNKP